MAQLPSACKNGHPFPESLSRTRNRCAVCHRDKQRQWAEANRAAKRANDRAYYARNSDRIKANVKAWEAAYPDRARLTKYRSTKRWRALHPERYQELNRAHARKRILGRNSDAYAYAEILRSDPCSYCGGLGGTVDHIVALAAGGPNEWENLTGACGLCNSRKQDKPFLTFLLERREVVASR